MNRPLRGERESAATTRYVGCFVLPIRMSRSFTATVRTSFSLWGPASLPVAEPSIQSREAIIADSRDGERRRLRGCGLRALGRDAASGLLALALGLLHLAAQTRHVPHAFH